MNESWVEAAWYSQVRLGLCAVAIAVLTACGGGGSTNEGSAGGNGGTEKVDPPTSAPMPTLTLGIKEVHLTWPEVSGATSYQLLESPDGTSSFVAVGTAFTETAVKHPIALYQRVNASYKVQACNAGGCTESAVKALSGSLVEAVGHFKASNSRSNIEMGDAVALSADGKTLAVGAGNEDGAATGVGGNQSNTAAAGSGAVYVFTKVEANWTQQAYIKASNSEAGDGFGKSISLSSDGNTLAVGAMREDSAATGINGDQTSNSASDSGAVYVFTRTGNDWSQQAYIKASNTGSNDRFGLSVALSSDGSTLAVGADGEDSASTGQNGDQSSNSAVNSGAVYVFIRAGGTWSQQAYIKASNTGAGDYFGTAVALSSSGDTLAVAAYGEASAATGVNGDQSDNSADYSGVVYIFTRSGSTWPQQAYIKASNTEAYDFFGRTIALSSDGDILAVGADGESSNASGIGGDQLNNNANSSGAVYVFARTGNTWNQQGYIKASNTGVNDNFGTAVALSADGYTLAIGAIGEDSTSRGINGSQADNSASSSGAVYVFTRSGNSWAQQAYVKANNQTGTDYFGSSVALSGDARTLAVGAVGESSTATGIGNAQDENGASRSGAVYLY